MRIYFTANPQVEQRLQDRFSRMIDMLNAAGVLVMSNLVQSNLTGFTPHDMERITQSGEVLLEKMDGLIIEASEHLAESGYLVALALTYEKPILYLTEKGKPVDKNLRHLQKDKKAARLLQLQSYTDANVQDILSKFIEHIEQGEGRESPTIKFTLRITPRIERYLKWKTHNTKLSKADFLRNQIEDLIDQDDTFKKFLEKDRNK